MPSLRTTLRVGPYSFLCHTAAIWGPEQPLAPGAQPSPWTTSSYARLSVRRPPAPSPGRGPPAHLEAAAPEGGAQLLEASAGGAGGGQAALQGTARHGRAAPQERGLQDRARRPLARPLTAARSR